MVIDELLEHLAFEYHANRAAVCQGKNFPRLLDQDKVAKFPSFYDWLLTRGFSRYQLSAYGIGRDIVP